MKTQEWSGGNQAFRAYVSRLRAKHGDKFDPGSLAPTFAAHFGERVEVEYSYGIKKRGWISGTDGWCPSLNAHAAPQLYRVVVACWLRRQARAGS